MFKKGNQHWKKGLPVTYERRMRMKKSQQERRLRERKIRELKESRTK